MSTNSYSPVHRRGRPWSPGVFRGFPLTGIGALVVVMLGVGGAIAVLITSDGRLLEDWIFAPTVYLSIASTVTNIALQVALTEALNTAWWRKALRPGTQVNDLHRYWEFGNSLKAASLSGRNINLAAIACILAAIAPINGPLLQRASRVNIESIKSFVDIDLPIATQMPQQWYSGYVSGRGYSVSLYTANFTPIASGYSSGTPISMNNTGCAGQCSTRVAGIGLAINCSSYESPFTLIYDTQNPLGISQPVVVNGTVVFDTHFTWTMADTVEGSDYGHDNFTLYATYKPHDACNGTLVNQACSLRLAQVEYPIVIDKNKSTIALDPSTTIYDDRVGSPLDLDPNVIQGPSYLAGYWLALQNKWASTSRLRWVGAVGYEVTGTGFSTPASYAILSTQDFSAGTNCSLHFRNPLDDMVQSARELLFRASVGAAQTDPSVNTQHITSATQTLKTGVYRSHYAYLVGACATSLIATVFITALFHGYWQIGRPVSMSPIETAKAFDAPLLRGCDSNATAAELLTAVGGEPVIYGAVMTMENSDASDPEASSIERVTAQRGKYEDTFYHGVTSGNHEEQVVSRLMVARPGMVELPVKGQRFVG